jgi:glycosyltransferase involved in cell wall biosynthesis
MDKLRVLHITPWLPNEKKPSEGIFILEHISSLKPYCENEILYLYFGEKNSRDTFLEENIRTTKISLKPFMNKWIFKEKSADRAVHEFLFENKGRFDIINFHIAYPNAIKIGNLKQRYPDLKFVITEHWTAYHQEFNLAKNSKGRQRIEAIFKHDIPIITVSKALKEDIENFTGTKQQKVFIVPNILRTDIFNYRPKIKTDNFIFASINNWNPMKNPLVLIHAFAELYQTNKQLQLVLGGEGVLIEEMEKLVKQLDLQHAITFTYKLTKQEVAVILHAADAYVQSSNYETFSVICAEAIACGTPVIVTKIGGMLDFIHEENGILVDDLKVSSWVNAMKKMLEKREQFDSEKIAHEAHDRFNKASVGHKYFTCLKEIRDAE